MQSVRFNLDKISPILFFILLALTGFLIVDRQFIMDDAYISFIYARNFAEGHGFSWYPGSDEYGYTSFLFTFLVGVLMKLGMNVPLAAYVISMPAALIGIVLVHRIGNMIGGRLVGLLAMLGLATNTSYAAFATGGLETSLALSLVLAVYFCIARWRESSEPRFVWLTGVYAALALLTRLDTALLLFPAYGLLLYFFYYQYRDGVTVSKLYNHCLITVGFPALAVLALVAFALAHYGQPLPNSFYIKMNEFYVLQGLRYLHAFLKAQYYMPLVLFILWFWMARLADFQWQYWTYRLTFLVGLLIWLVYVILVGGDFMEFRLVLPLLPFFYLLMADLVCNAVSRRGVFSVVTAAFIIIAGNYFQPSYFQHPRSDQYELESTAQLQYWMDNPGHNWIMAGKALNNYFYTGQSDDVIIAVTAAGAIPYYSRLPTIDEHGLNSHKMMADARQYADKPGHRYAASVPFMKQSGVNLLIHHPIFIQKSINQRGQQQYRCYEMILVQTHNWFWRIPVVLLPVGDNLFLMAHYLTPHPKVEALLREKKALRLTELDLPVVCGGMVDNLLLKAGKSP